MFVTRARHAPHAAQSACSAVQLHARASAHAPSAEGRRLHHRASGGAAVRYCVVLGSAEAPSAVAHQRVWPRRRTSSSASVTGRSVSLLAHRSACSVVFARTAARYSAHHAHAQIEKQTRPLGEGKKARCHPRKAAHARRAASASHRKKLQMMMSRRHQVARRRISSCFAPRATRPRVACVMPQRDSCASMAFHATEKTAPCSTLTSRRVPSPRPSSPRQPSAASTAFTASR